MRNPEHEKLLKDFMDFLLRDKSFSADDRFMCVGVFSMALECVADPALLPRLMAIDPPKTQRKAA